MLNKNKERELAYVVKVDNVEPIEGYDRIRYATVNGWHCVVGLDINAGDLCVYFEIDSLLNKTDERFSFCEKYNYRIKNQKYCKGTKLSQGLLMPLSAFPELSGLKEGDFCTKELKVTYYDPIDQQRKRGTGQTETSPLFKKLKKHFPFKQLMKTKIGSKVLLSIFRLRKKKQSWPAFVPKTDEERIQNMPYILKDKSAYEVSEKIDGCSSTYAACKDKFGKIKIWVCSRNVVLTRKSSTYYGAANVWFDMYDKYNIEQFLRDYIKNNNVDWVYLQGETYGNGVQKRDYSIGDRDFRAFILCDSRRVRYTYNETKEILSKYNIPTVPILKTDYILPDTVEELLDYAAAPSLLDGLPREGIVLRKIDDPTVSFKAVDNAYIDKYH